MIYINSSGRVGRVRAGSLCGEGKAECGEGEAEIGL